MKKEQIFIDVWVVSYFNVIDGLHYNNLYNTCDDAIVDFDKIVDEAIKSASEELGDFRVSKNVHSLTIYNIEDDRVVIACTVSKKTILCGIMCM